LCPQDFSDDQAKIAWALSFMKSGRAATFANRVLEWEAENLGDEKYLEWEDFEDDFRRHFLPPDAETTAINRLESEAYFQRARSVEDYLDEFRDLIAESKYRDERVIVVKFRRGLHRQVQNAIATMASGRPANDNSEGWYTAALSWDRNRAANEAFLSTRTPPAPSAARPAPLSAFRPTPSSLPPRQSHAHAVPTPGNPVPMDLDVAKKRASAPLTCYRCGKLGHTRAECPSRIDVRALSAEEKEDLLEQLLAEKDAEKAELVLEEDDPRADAADEDFLSDRR
jgi:hypothetical protein